MTQATAVFDFVKDARNELKKVVWPTRRQTLKLTAIVLGVSVSIALYIGLLDVAFTSLVNQLIIR